MRSATRHDPARRQSHSSPGSGASGVLHPEAASRRRRRSGKEEPGIVLWLKGGVRDFSEMDMALVGVLANADERLVVNRHGLVVRA